VQQVKSFEGLLSAQLAMGTMEYCWQELESEEAVAAEDVAAADADAAAAEDVAAGEEPQKAF